MDLYGQEIIELYKNPPHKKKLTKPTYTKSDKNESCGDKITLYLMVDVKEKITKASYTGTGCAISQASANIFIDEIIGQKLSNVKKIKEKEFLELLQIPISPARKKCATLILKTIKN